jgi:hypothetical protein
MATNAAEYEVPRRIYFREHSQFARYFMDRTAGMQ